MGKANLIELNARDGKDTELGDFLRQGGALVRRTEPNTKCWYALEASGGRFAIFDTFAGPEGRAEHFGGQVAAALQQRAPVLVDGGWQQGVLGRVRSYDVLAATAVSERPPAKATCIRLRAKPGRAQQLQALLEAGRGIVAETEPNTLYWVAMRDEQDGSFAIFDLFADERGRQDHFGGKVAAALEAAADDLVEGGWHKGVLHNVAHYQVRSAK
jgi:quinol monooxygenase YgiN